jgi:hypothetical protein
MRNRAAHLDRVANGAHEAGQRRWSESTRTGDNASAARRSDVVALGMRRASASPSPSPELSPEMLELRRQQAAFKGVTRQLDRDNRWMAAAVLAPIAAVGGLEAATYSVAQQFLNPPGEPLQLPGRQPLLQRGDTYYARYGRQQDKAFREQVKAKPGWTSQPREVDEGELRIPDAQAPVRPDRVAKFLELKPDTPSGRRAGQEALRKYKNLGKTRVVYYRPPPK